MESGGKGSFEPWLKQLLDSHGVDGEVFGEYISGTLGTMEDSTADEISENLQDILSGCVVCRSQCSASTVYLLIIVVNIGR